jgi:hypothetical protein
LNPALIRMSEMIGLGRLKFTHSCSTPTSIAAGWNICVASTSRRKTSRPRNRCRAV